MCSQTHNYNRLIMKEVIKRTFDAPYLFLDTPLSSSRTSPSYRASPTACLCSLSSSAHCSSVTAHACSALSHDNWTPLNTTCHTHTSNTNTNSLLQDTLRGGTINTFNTDSTQYVWYNVHIPLPKSNHICPLLQLFLITDDVWFCDVSIIKLYPVWFCISYFPLLLIL